ncbi:dihydropteroate synthase [Desulfonatronospira sp.]|uniref:dihydropteroate synthase n=1 Tax=Desulfonatronospira sp. TaxID=1962951 RepID=UPI0025C6C339|nr:dihydropteroate synthase [Desulfonatronospira sp.]
MVRWSVRGGGVIGPAPFLIAGVVNITPDSFYDGGSHYSPEAAALHGLELLNQGAHILDLGGESTRPFSQRVDADTELDRVMPVLQKLLKTLPEAGISVDTYKSRVAARCLEAGALIINDISACRFDPELLDVLAQYKPGYVLMHTLDRPENMQADPQYSDVTREILSFFETHLSRLVQAGIPENRIVLDPGIGFGKTLEHNLEIMRNIERFHVLGRPLYMGLSQKSLWSGLLKVDLKDRGMPTQVGTALMAARKVGIHRVHDVADTVKTLKIVENTCS